MKIYFAGSISGGRKYLDTYRRIISHLKASDHQVLSEHVALTNVLDLEQKLSSQGIYERDVQLLGESEVVIAEVSNPSLGVGYEICYALGLGKPVLCLHQNGLFISRMITGNTSRGLKVFAYHSEKEMLTQIDTFLRTVELYE